MRVEVACTLFARLRGLLGRGKDADALLLAPCNDIHTFGMRHEIDVAFISADGVVLESYRNVSSRCRLRCSSAYATLERVATSASWFERGDCVDLKRLLKEAVLERKTRR